ncbi:hypothetical protein TB2_033691 [Malus domestica]
MTSSKGQAVLATTEGRILSTSAANGQSIGATTAPQHATSKLVLLKEQGEHPRCESVINLTSLGAPKHDAEAHKMTSQSSQRRSSSASWMSKGKSRLLVAQVMTIGVTSVEEQLAQMNEAIARLTQIVEEKDLQIAALVSRLEPQDGENLNPEDEPTVERIDVKPEPDQVAALMGSLSIQQLQEMITNTIKAQYEGSSNTSELYSKPYSKKIDALKMPRGYQPPKFMQFDGKGNPKQHVAHFVETCNNAGTEGDYLAKQFVRSLKGNAFEWYTDLEPESINNWEQLEREFLNRFYSNCRTVSMPELTSTNQWKDEPVINYTNRWRTLSLDCIKPRTLEELATRAHDMELSIAHHAKKKPIADYKNDKVVGPKEEKTAWKPTKETMTVYTAPIKISTRGKAIQTEAFRDQEMRRRTLKELEEKTYPFLEEKTYPFLDFEGDQFA